jgi:hypothetical protein
MTDEELIARLREDQPVTQDMVSTMQCALQAEAADRIEALGREKTYLLDRAMEQDDRTDTAEARLAKAVEALRWYAESTHDDAGRRAEAVLAEIGGEG